MLFSLKDFRSQKIIVKLLGMPEKGEGRGTRKNLSSQLFWLSLIFNVSLDLLRDFIA